MRNFKHLLMITLVAGCSSAPSVEKKAEVLQYSRSVHSVSLSDTSGSGCSEDTKKMDTEGWRDVVRRAGACVKMQKWRSVQVLGDYLASREPHSPWGSYFLSLSAEVEGFYERALWMVDLSLKKAPELGILHYQKARIHWKKNEIDPALQWFQSALQRDGSLVDAHAFLGQIFFRDQDYGSAAKHFHIVLESRSRDAVALSGLAECRLQSGDSQGAMEYIRRAVSAYPDRAEFQVRQAYILESHMNDPNGALDYYMRAQKTARRQKVSADLQSEIDSKVKDLTAQLERAPASEARAPKKQEVKR